MTFRTNMLLLLLISPTIAAAQIDERFNDGNYAQNPPWKGDTASWKINDDKELQSNSSVVNDFFYLSTENKKAVGTEWRLTIKLNFNTSSANYTDIYLISSSESLRQTDNTGYFVRMGNSSDEISLYRKDKQSAVKIIDGIDGTLNSSNSNVVITIKRDNYYRWQLFRKINQNEEILEGMATDSTYQASAYFGILVKQSTTSFFGKHFFDNIEIKELLPDTLAPEIVSVMATGENTADILFNEPLEKESAEITSNYSADHSLFMPASALLDSLNSRLVHLKYNESFPVRTPITLTVNGIKDLSGNVLNAITKKFVRYVPAAFDLVITEIMADPEPVVKLPNTEWIEIKNNSPFDINLKNWKIAKESSTGNPLKDYILKSGNYAILCSSTAASSMSAYGNLIPITNFPSLNNNGDLIYLLSPEEKVIHAVRYFDSWYNNALKKNGGWSLEMIDTNNPCTGAGNWSASTDDMGATPGQLNSINGPNADTISPKIIHAFANDSMQILLYFNEPLDSISAENIIKYDISDGIGKPLRATALPPLFEKVSLDIATPLSKGMKYTITLNGITDCKGNAIFSNSNVFVALEEKSDSIDVVINEILFNPKSDGADYVEIYNRSNKTVNLKKLSLGGMNIAGQIIQINALQQEDRLLFPKEYAVFTEDVSALQRNYLIKNPGAVFIIKELASMADDEGKIVLLNEEGQVIDKLFYKDDWHFKLLNNTEGISLERIDVNVDSQNEQNWHSASEFAVYGTPGYQNSQLKQEKNNTNNISIHPEVFSPDNDGHDDFLSINYLFDKPGYLLNIVIYDASGRIVRRLQNNNLCGIKGFYRWDGLDDVNRMVQQGIYIVYAEALNVYGKIKKFKSTVVVAK